MFVCLSLSLCVCVRACVRARLRCSPLPPPQAQQAPSPAAPVWQPVKAAPTPAAMPLAPATTNAPFAFNKPPPAAGLAPAASTAAVTSAPPKFGGAALPAASTGGFKTSLFGGSAAATKAAAPTGFQPTPGFGQLPPGGKLPVSPISKPPPLGPATTTTTATAGSGAGAAVIKPFTVPSFGGQPAAASDAFAGMRATSAEAHTVQIKTADPLPVGQGQWQGKEGMTTNTPAPGPASGKAEAKPLLEHAEDMHKVAAEMAKDWDKKIKKNKKAKELEKQANKVFNKLNADSEDGFTRDAASMKAAVDDAAGIIKDAAAAGDALVPLHTPCSCASVPLCQPCVYHIQTVHQPPACPYRRSGPCTDRGLTGC